LTASVGKLIVCLDLIGKELLVRQRAKVGRIKLADFFVPLMGFTRREKYER
jgi:hypothetical protein